MSLAAYSSSNLEITLSDDAWDTIHVVKVITHFSHILSCHCFWTIGGAQDKVASVIDTGDSVVEGLEGTIDSLHDIVQLMQTDINITHLRQNIQVTKPPSDLRPDATVPLLSALTLS